MKALVSEQLVPQQQGREPYRGRWPFPYCAFQPMFLPMSQTGTVQSPSHAPDTEKGLSESLPETKETVPFRLTVEFGEPASQFTAEDFVMSW